MSSEDIVALALGLKTDGPISDAEIKELSKAGKFVSISTIRDRFGSIVSFQRACGFEVEEKTVFKAKDMSNEDLIALALELQPGEKLTNNDLERLNRGGLFVGTSTIIDRFGSIPAFQRACGFEAKDTVSRTRGLDKEGIIALALSIKPDSPLTVEEIHGLSHSGRFVSYTTIRGRFGSISDFQEACGFEAIHRVKKNY